MHKRKIIFCCYGLGIGGIEKCLINLLNAIDTTRYDIDVLPMNPEYTLLEALHAEVNLLEPFDYVMNTTDTMAALRKREASLFEYGKYVIFRLVNKWGKKPWRLFSAPKKQYDIAIAYAHTGYVPYYVIDRIQAKKKYMWHHEGRYVKDSRYELDQKYYPKFDSIIPVSIDDRNVLMEVFPELKDKFHVLYNVVDRAEIRRKAEEAIEYNTDTHVLKITTVGRLTEQKGPDLLIEVAEILRKKDIDFLWYWVGSGNLEGWFKREIELRGLSKNIRIMGNQNNPYPFIAKCDIYVQPSRYEAYCTTTLEAQVLEKPIIATDVCGMREQFTDGEDGILTKVDVNSITTAILDLYYNPKKRVELSGQLSKKMHSTDKTLQAYYEFFDGNL